MREFNSWMRWTLHGFWIIPMGYILGSLAGLIIHGLFGFSMAENGSYLSNALMGIVSGTVLGLGVGVVQKDFLQKFFPVSNMWIFSLLIGFAAAELIAGVVLWQLNMYRSLLNIFNTDVHYPEALIFALAGFISGIIQIGVLKPYYRKRLYWVISSTLGWGLILLFAYIGIWAFFLGVLFYGAITGFVLLRVLEPTKIN